MSHLYEKLGMHYLTYNGMIYFTVNATENGTFVINGSHIHLSPGTWNVSHNMDGSLHGTRIR